jgi:hypothetical protein
VPACGGRQNKVKLVLLAEILPALAVELYNFSRSRASFALAAQVPQLAIVGRCRCGDELRPSFYTQPEPKGAYGPAHHCVDLNAAEGMLNLDVVAGTIAHVEVLNRDDLRRTLVAVFPSRVARCETRSFGTTK